MNGNQTMRGFTLIELMITVAVVAILTAIALPSYAAYVQRANRASARATLLQAAQWMERAATAQGKYPDTLPAMTVEGNRYTVQFDAGYANSSTQFRLMAKRNSPGGNANDACGDYTIDNTGQRGILNAAASVSVNDCWGR
jgi:type IV pilus assembly protein PilE